MKALLKLIYLISILIIIFLLSGLFLNKSYHFNDSITINTNANLVYDQMNTIANWQLWAPWFNKDTTMQVEYTDSVSGAGAGYSWISSIYGSGSLHISNSSTDEIKGEINFNEQAKCQFTFRLNKLNKNTRVLCNMHFTDVAFFERYYLFFLGNNAQRHLKETLKSLKLTCEELRLSRTSYPILSNFPETVFMTHIDTSKNTVLQDDIKYNFNRLKKYMKRRQLKIVGDSLVIYFTDTLLTKTHYACAYPIESKTWSWKKYQCITVDSTYVASVKHWGDYQSSKPYDALSEFIRNQNYTPDSFYWETYQVFPENEPDTSFWEKTIYFPVK